MHHSLSYYSISKVNCIPLQHIVVRMKIALRLFTVLNNIFLIELYMSTFSRIFGICS